VEDVSRAILAHNPGDKIEVKWKRGGNQMSATVTLGRRGG
jgi:S1-C subfamily serine protease